jgi:beta-mannosidase
MQYYILRNSIATHRSKSPTNMGTLLWQLNDCWPVASWSITDYSRQPKAAWYAVREAYRDDVLPVKDSVYPKDLKLEKPIISMVLTGNELKLTADKDAKYIQLSKGGNTALFSDNYFDLKKGKEKIIKLKSYVVNSGYIANLKIKTLYDIINAQ